MKLKAEFKKQTNIRKIRTLKAMGNIKPTINPYPGMIRWGN